MQTQEKALYNLLSASGYNKKLKQILPLTSDASLREYYRLVYDTQSSILMDARNLPSCLEPYITTTKLLGGYEVKVPKIYAANLEESYLIIEDFGDKFLSADITKYMPKALDTIHKLQLCKIEDLPSFDNRVLYDTIMLFKTWFVEKHLGIQFTEQENQIFNTNCINIINIMMEQPFALCHKDYRAGNIMVVGEELGIIDFQDAIQGPITYDASSIIKDCRIKYSPEQINSWFDYFYDGGNFQLSKEKLRYYFDICALHFHLRVIGVFCRLKLRDNKPQYMQYLDIIFDYVRDFFAEHSEFLELESLIISLMTAHKNS
jgi:N-acetylmuramate 1-kinase